MDVFRDHLSVLGALFFMLPVGAAPSAGPLLIPNDPGEIALPGADAGSWPPWPRGLPQRDLPPHVEREYKLGVPGWEGAAAKLAAGIDALLAEVTAGAGWAAPPLVQEAGGQGYRRRDPQVQEKVFTDFYFDNAMLLNWRHGVEYRLRQRFKSPSDWVGYLAGAAGAQPTRVEFMAKMNPRSVTGSPGLTEVDEYRFQTERALGRGALPEMLAFFSLGRVPYDFTYSEDEVVHRGEVGNPAWAVVEHYRYGGAGDSSVHSDGRFAFTPQVYVKTTRYRQHLVFMPRAAFLELLGEDRESFQAYIVTVDEAHAWPADEVLAYVNGTAAALPPARGSFLEVEVEFDKSTAEEVDKAIAGAAAGSPELAALTEVREAFTADLSRLVDLIGRRYPTAPKTGSKYRQARRLALPRWNLGQLHGALVLDGVPAGGGGSQVFSFTPLFTGPMWVHASADGGSVAVSLSPLGVGELAVGEGAEVVLDAAVTGLETYEITVEGAGAAGGFYDLRFYGPDAFGPGEPPPVLDVVSGQTYGGGGVLAGTAGGVIRIRMADQDPAASAFVTFTTRRVAGSGSASMEFFVEKDGRRVAGSTPGEGAEGVESMTAFVRQGFVYRLQLRPRDGNPGGVLGAFDLSWDCPVARHSGAAGGEVTIARVSGDGRLAAVDLGPVDHRSRLEKTNSLGGGRWSPSGPASLPAGASLRLYHPLSAPAAFFRRARIAAGPADIALNEVCSDNAVGDYVEITNSSDEPYWFPQGLWSIRDEDDTHVYKIPGGTRIAPHGFFLVRRAALGFGLGTKDEVRLFRDGHLHDYIRWKSDVGSLGRLPDGRGWSAGEITPTPGSANRP